MTLGSHQRCVGKSQVHLTPKWLIDALGPFDLDPCAADPRPWDCARVNFTEADNGLSKAWAGMVWLNPPFNRYEVGRWIQRLANHGSGIALIHARTEAQWFQPVWRQADGIMFLDKRIKFCRPDGTEQPANSGAPPVLAAFGQGAVMRLLASNLTGSCLEAWTCVIRDSDGTATAALCEDIAVPQDCQARVQSTSPKPPSNTQEAA